MGTRRKNRHYVRGRNVGLGKHPVKVAESKEENCGKYLAGTFLSKY
jgi:hypothetical protein